MADSTPDASAPIWQVDWSQFFPDVIITFAAGAAIGWWLWRVQAKADERSDRRQAEAIWGVVRSDFAAVIMPIPTNVHHTAKQVVDEFQRLAGVALRYPMVAAWSESAPKNRELALVRALLVKLPQLKRESKDLEWAVTSRAQAMFSSGASRRRALAEHCFLVLLGNEPGTTLGDQLFVVSEDASLADEILRDAEIQVLASTFNETHLGMMADHAELARLLRA